MDQALLCQVQLINNVLSKKQHRLLRQGAFYLFGILALSISSKIAFPLAPVPITLQTFMVLLIGMTYGSRLGGLTVISYIALGAMGAPVFASPVGGLATILGPSGGYIMGFLPAAFFTGVLVERGWGHYRLTTACATLIGMAIIYGYGVLWLAKFVGFQSAINLGVLPFIMVCMLKVLLLSVIVPAFWKRPK